MKKFMTTIWALLLAIAMQAQDANTLRYYLSDKSTFDIRISELSQIKRIGTTAIKNMYADSDKGSKDFLLSNVDSIVLVYVDYPETDNNTNRNTDPRAWRLEYPKLKGGTMNILSIHSTDAYGITYSLEWDCTKLAQRWSCYEMHDGNSAKNVSRTDAWGNDPNIPSQYLTYKSDYSSSGYSRGHMCPSGDRLCSAEQNKQTFYYSNMQPQLNAHNSGLWEKMEEQVRKWNTASFRDTLYVVKGGTIDNGLTMGSLRDNGTVPIPAYFYMAILCKKGSQYKALAFWTKHEKLSGNMADYVVSIKELEEKTGIDFFCNLPDDIEVQVEAETNASDWGL